MKYIEVVIVIIIKFILDDLPGDTAESMIEATKTGMKNPKISEWKSNPEGIYQNFVIHGSSLLIKIDRMIVGKVMVLKVFM